MEQLKSEALKTMLTELAAMLHDIYCDKLKTIILYGSVARGTATDESDIDIAALIDGTDEELMVLYIRAVNILDGFDASKHSSVIAHFNQYYVHKGKFDRNTYKLIDSAYRIREKCDYSDFFIASKQDSEKQVKNAKVFIDTVESY